MCCGGAWWPRELWSPMIRPFRAKLYLAPTVMAASNHMIPSGRTGVHRNLLSVGDVPPAVYSPRHVTCM